MLTCHICCTKSFSFDVGGRLTNSIYITLLNIFAETRTVFTLKEYKMFKRTTCVRMDLVSFT